MGSVTKQGVAWRLSGLASILLASWGIVAATSCRTRIRTCATGEEIACDCIDGTRSVQVCGADEAFEPCQCGEGGSSATGGGGEGGALVPDFPDGAVMIDVGTERLVEAFRHGDLIQIVTRQQTRVVTTAGEVVGTIPSPSENMAAASVGDMLAVASKDTLRLFDPMASSVLAVAALVAPCEDVGLFDGPVAVCSPGSASQDEPFVTYDATTGDVLATSMLDGWNAGSALHAVPGSGDFVTAFATQWLNLYRITAEGTVAALGRSEKVVDYPLSDVMAVLGSPPSFIATDTGALRRIHGNDCKAELEYSSVCFEHDGYVGQPGVNHHYWGMVADGPDAFYGLYNYVDFPYGESCLYSDCVVKESVLHRYELDSKTVTGEALVGEDLRKPVRILPDDDGQGAVLAYNRAPPPFEGPPYPGYRVIWVPLD